MDVGEISSNAFKYPFSDFKKVLILGILSILSFLIIPAFLYVGYLFRILKASIAGVEELPEFGEWGEMFMDGLKVFAVLLVYTVIPTVILIIGMWASLLPLIAAQNAESITIPTISFGLISGLVIIGVILEIIISFLVIIALANMAYYGEIGAAFRFRGIIDKMGDIGWVDYLIWYVVMIILWVVFLYISSFLVFPFIIGIILVPLIISPYFMMFFARSTALIYVFGGSDDYLKGPL
jgi:hypothetical protein